tara:strand:+ start:3795 stop:4259 length:465 start_codon:yes stop_codon:yes gene_type:complete
MEGMMTVESKINIFEIAQPPISCKLIIAAEQPVVNGIFVDFILFNNIERDLSVLTWHTPLEGFYSKLFIITDQYNEQVDYQGPIIKRANPSPEDYQLIRANGNVATLLDLSLVYDLIPGDYKIKLNKKTLQVIENDMPFCICQCEIDTLTFRVS